MGFLSKIFKPVAKLIDPLLPESVKSIAQKGYLGIAGEALVLPKEEPAAAPATAATTPDPTVYDGALPAEEAQALSAKRMARLGKYFTSPLGVMGNASTGSQKVFS